MGRARGGGANVLARDDLRAWPAPSSGTTLDDGTGPSSKGPAMTTMTALRLADGQREATLQEVPRPVTGPAAVVSGWTASAT